MGAPVAFGDPLGILAIALAIFIIIPTLIGWAIYAAMKPPRFHIHTTTITIFCVIVTYFMLPIMLGIR